MAVTPYLAEDQTLTVEWNRQKKRLLSIMSLLRPSDDEGFGDFVIVAPAPNEESFPYVQARKAPWGYQVEVQSNFYLKNDNRQKWYPQQLDYFKNLNFEMDDADRQGNYRTVRDTPEEATEVMIEVLRRVLIVKTPWQLHMKTSFGDAYTRVGHKTDDTEEGEVKGVLSAAEAKEQLTELVGLTEVKDKVRRLEVLARMMQVWPSDDIDVSEQSMHLIFTGNPGTAKTTVARLIGSLFKGAGLLKKGHVHEVSRADLVAPYIGQTAPLVREAVEKAIGGVLFIDEAYTLFTNSGDDRQDFGHEAVAELLRLMENRRNEFVVIAAGYPIEMLDLVNSNPGFASRFRWTLEFPDYTDDEIAMIFFRMAAKMNFNLSGFEVQERVKQAMPKYRSEGFSNGRWARKLLEETLLNTANRVDAIPEAEQTTEVRTTIIPDDVPRSLRSA